MTTNLYVVLFCLWGAATGGLFGFVLWYCKRNNENVEGLLDAMVELTSDVNTMNTQIRVLRRRLNLFSVAAVESQHE